MHRTASSADSAARPFVESGDLARVPPLGDLVKLRRFTLLLIRSAHMGVTLPSTTTKNPSGAGKMSWSASSNALYQPTFVGMSREPPPPPPPPLESPPSASSATSATSSSPGSEQPTTDKQELGQRQNSVSSTIPDAARDRERDRATVPSACVQCRSKHLKCDGLNPCTRCSSNSLDCLYVRSRRGFKGPRRNGAQSNNNKSATTSAIGTTGATGTTGTTGTTAPPRACPLVHPDAASIVRVSPNVSNALAPPPDHRLLLPPPPVDLPQFHLGQELVAFDSKSLPVGLDLRERCIEAFFYHFYPAHPFLLPRANFMAMRKERPMDCLEAAMRYVGSFYVEQAPTVALGVEAEVAAYHMNCPKDGFRVQALLVLAIGLDGYTFQEKALQILIDAQNLALELGMNKREFAFLNGNGSNFVEESWRRTWWELFIVDGMIAGVHQKSSFRLNEMPADVDLPCEEKEYISGQIPLPHSISDFDNESFDERDLHFSSFTYRIAAIRNLGRVLSSRQIVLADKSFIDRIDAHLVNWKLHIPDSKKHAITSDGQLDEMLFQAHMITEATTILLHREHSQLDSSVAQNVTSCAPHKQIVPGESYNVHAAKTIQAAQDISKLITLPVPLAKHTHFFTCVVTLASIVHLSCWSVLIQDDDLKQQLRLNTGALKSLWQVWPSAGCAFGQVKGVAQEIHAAKKQAAAVGFGDWTNYSEEEVMRGLIEDQTIMEELQLL